MSFGTRRLSRGAPLSRLRLRCARSAVLRSDGGGPTDRGCSGASEPAPLSISERWSWMDARDIVGSLGVWKGRGLSGKLDVVSLIRTSQQQLLLSYQWLTGSRSHTALLYWPVLLRATRFSESSGGFRTGWQLTAEREPTCVTSEAGHYSRTLASKAGNHSRHLLLVRKTKSADVDSWSGGCQDQAVSGDGDKVVGRRGTDALAQWVAEGTRPRCRLAPTT